MGPGRRANEQIRRRTDPIVTLLLAAARFVYRTMEWVRTNLKIGRRYGTPRGYSYAVTSRHLRVPL